MTYSIIISIFLSIIIITSHLINVYGQFSNSSVNDQNINQTELQVAQPNDQNISTKVIKVSSADFNKLLSTIKESINSIEDEDYDTAVSELGLAIIGILNSTGQYQELVRFASSQYVDNVKQQANKNEDE